MSTLNLRIVYSATAELRDRSLLNPDTKFRSGQRLSATNDGGYFSDKASVAPLNPRVNRRREFKLFWTAQNTRVEEHSDFRDQRPNVTLFNLNISNGPDVQCRGQCLDKESQISNWLTRCRELPSGLRSTHGGMGKPVRTSTCLCASMDDQETESDEGTDNATEQSDETLTPGVALAIAALKFYKREISPLLPGSCRYVPTCSEYGMQSFKKYGVVKGTILTAWRLSRCNPLGGSGFDPPRWFDEARPPPY